MKRAYPYSAGPTNGGGAQQQSGAAATLTQPASSGSVADFSAYGYGTTANATSNDAQQAQWHQQWQQYYAQQAAATAGAPSSASSVAVQQQPAANGSARGGIGAAPSQAYSYGAPATQQQPAQPPAQMRQHVQPQQQQQQPPQQQQFYGQYTPQQPQPGPSAYTPWSAGAPSTAMGPGQQANNYAMQGQAGIYQPHSGPQMQAPPPQQQQHGYYNAGPHSPSGNAAKRPRLEQGGYGAPGGAPAQLYGSPQPASLAHGAWQQSPPPQRFPAVAQSMGATPRVGMQQAYQHPIPGRPLMGAPHAGGPSNMAGPMYEPSRIPGMPQRPTGGRSARNPQDNTRGGRGGQQQGSSSNGSNTGSGGAGGKFAGPVGVNALPPMSGSARAGFGQRNAPSGRKVQPVVVRGGRTERTRNDEDTLSSGLIPKGPAGAKTAAESGLEMDKAPLQQGRTSTPIDHPVPITAKRTFTDFKINGIEIDPIQWQWQREDDEANEAGTADGPDATADQASQADTSSTVDNAARSSRTRSRRRPRGKANKAGQKTATSSRREAVGTGARMRIAIVANPPPAGAPTGPRALLSTTESKADADDLKPLNGDDEHKSDSATDQSLEWTAFSKGPPQCSANRLTITYGASKRRLVIDSEVVKSVEVNRAQGTIRILVDVFTSAGLKRQDQQDKTKGEEWVVAKGVVLEARSTETDNFVVVSRRELEKAWNDKSGIVEEEKETEVKAEEDEAEAEADPESMAPKLEEASDDKDKVGTHADEAELQVKKEGEDESVVSAIAEEVTDASAARDDLDGEEKDGAGDGEKVLDDFESLPPFYRLLSKHDGPVDDAEHAAAGVSEMCITLFLDDLTNEAKWIRTGDLAEWLAALPGIQTSLTTDPLRAWVDKIRVADPDPPPTLTEVFDEWVKKSIAGTALLRRQFLQDHHLSTATGLTEVFARLIVAVQGGDRGAASAAALLGMPAVGVTSLAMTPSAKELGKPLQDSLASSLFDAHHSHVSLAVLSMMQMLRELAPSDDAVAARLQDLLLCMPMHLIFRSLDDLCKDALDKQRLLQAKSRRGKQAQARSHVAGGGDGDASVAGADSVGPSSRAGSVGGASVAPEEQRPDGHEVVAASESHPPAEDQKMNDEPAPFAAGDATIKTEQLVSGDLAEQAEGVTGPSDDQATQEEQHIDAATDVQDNQQGAIATEALPDAVTVGDEQL